MTEQSATARSGGMWDMVFELVFGRRGPPARRQQPAPAPQPQPAPQAEPQPAPAPQPEAQAEPQPDPAPQPEAQAEPQPEPAPQPEAQAEPQPEPAPQAEPEPLPEPTTEAQTPIEEAPPPPLDPVTPAPVIEAPAATTSAFALKLVDFCVSEWNSFQQGALKENQDPAVRRIAAYWAHVDQPEWDGNTPEAWSAAFISFAMKEAGDDGRFKKNAGHCVYINDAIKRRDEPEAPFHGKRIEDYAPQLGDLICRNRGDSNVSFDTAPTTGWYSSHTDIVTAIKPGVVEMIGGNVSNSVSVSRLKLLPDGRLDPSDPKANGVFAIMKNNL